MSARPFEFPSTLPLLSVPSFQGASSASNVENTLLSPISLLDSASTNDDYEMAGFSATQWDTQVMYIRSD
jgi:hypothetical protein